MCKLGEGKKNKWNTWMYVWELPSSIRFSESPRTEKIRGRSLWGCFFRKIQTGESLWEKWCCSVSLHWLEKTLKTVTWKRKGGRSPSEPVIITTDPVLKHWATFYSDKKKKNPQLINSWGIDWQSLCKAEGEVEQKCSSWIVEPYPVRQRFAMNVRLL